MNYDLKKLKQSLEKLFKDNQYSTDPSIIDSMARYKMLQNKTQVKKG